MSKLFQDCKFLPVSCDGLQFPSHIGHSLFAGSCSCFEKGRIWLVFLLLLGRLLIPSPSWTSKGFFFRKSPFCTFSSINLRFGGPWVMIRKKKSYCHFHNASKEYFWPKKFLNFMHGFKSAILAKSFEALWKWQ